MNTQETSIFSHRCIEVITFLLIVSIHVKRLSWKYQREKIKVRVMYISSYSF